MPFHAGSDPQTSSWGMGIGGGEAAASRMNAFATDFTPSFLLHEEETVAAAAAMSQMAMGSDASHLSADLSTRHLSEEDYYTVAAELEQASGHGTEDYYAVTAAEESEDYYAVPPESEFYENSTAGPQAGDRLAEQIAEQSTLNPFAMDFAPLPAASCEKNTKSPDLNKYARTFEPMAMPESKPEKLNVFAKTFEPAQPLAAATPEKSGHSPPAALGPAPPVPPPPLPPLRASPESAPVASPAAAMQMPVHPPSHQPHLPPGAFPPLAPAPAQISLAPVAQPPLPPGPPPVAVFPLHPAAASAQPPPLPPGDYSSPRAPVLAAAAQPPLPPGPPPSAASSMPAAQSQPPLPPGPPPPAATHPGHVLPVTAYPAPPLPLGTQPPPPVVAPPPPAVSPMTPPVTGAKTSALAAPGHADVEKKAREHPRKPTPRTELFPAARLVSDATSTMQATIGAFGAFPPPLSAPATEPGRLKKATDRVLGGAPSPTAEAQAPPANEAAPGPAAVQSTMRPPPGLEALGPLLSAPPSVLPPTPVGSSHPQPPPPRLRPMGPMLPVGPAPPPPPPKASQQAPHPHPCGSAVSSVPPPPPLRLMPPPPQVVLAQEPRQPLLPPGEPHPGGFPSVPPAAALSVTALAGPTSTTGSNATPPRKVPPAIYYFEEGKLRRSNATAETSIIEGECLAASGFSDTKSPASTVASSTRDFGEESPKNWSLDSGSNNGGSYRGVDSPASEQRSEANLEVQPREAPYFAFVDDLDIVGRTKGVQICRLLKDFDPIRENPEPAEPRVMTKDEHILDLERKNAELRAKLENLSPQPAPAFGAPYGSLGPFVVPPGEPVAAPEMHMEPLMSSPLSPPTQGALGGGAYGASFPPLESTVRA